MAHPEVPAEGKAGRGPRHNSALGHIVPSSFTPTELPMAWRQCRTWLRGPGPGLSFPKSDSWFVTAFLPLPPVLGPECQQAAGHPTAGAVMKQAITCGLGMGRWGGWEMGVMGEQG